MRRHLVGAGRGVARDQLLERAVRVDAHLDALAGAAVEQLSRDRVAAQERRRPRIGDVEPREERIGGVADAGDVAAVEVEVVLGEGVELRMHVDGGDVLHHRALRQVGRHRAPAARCRRRSRRSRPGQAKPWPSACGDSGKRSWRCAPRRSPRRHRGMSAISISAELGAQFGRCRLADCTSVDRRERGATRIVTLVRSASGIIPPPRRTPPQYTGRRSPFSRNSQ